MTQQKECPACKGAVDYYADQCACGYAFKGAQTSDTAVLASIDNNVRTIKFFVVLWVILTLSLAAILWIVRMWS